MVLISKTYIVLIGIFVSNKKCFFNENQHEVAHLICTTDVFTDHCHGHAYYDTKVHQGNTQQSNSLL